MSNAICLVRDLSRKIIADEVWARIYRQDTQKVFTGKHSQQGRGSSEFSGLDRNNLSAQRILADSGGARTAQKKAMKIGVNLGYAGADIAPLGASRPIYPIAQALGRALSTICTFSLPSQESPSLAHFFQNQSSFLNRRERTNIFLLIGLR